MAADEPDPDESSGCSSLSAVRLLIESKLLVRGNDAILVDVLEAVEGFLWPTALTMIQSCSRRTLADGRFEAS